jgi:hypothetical protein
MHLQQTNQFEGIRYFCLHTSFINKGVSSCILWFHKQILENSLGCNRIHLCLGCLDFFFV